MLRQFPKFIHNSINGMFAPVQQNQVHIRKLFHFLSHMSLQSDATVSIVGYKSNVLRIGIDCPDHADVRRDVVFVQKTMRIPGASDCLHKNRKIPASSVPDLSRRPAKAPRSCWSVRTLPALLLSPSHSATDKTPTPPVRTE